jgi:hypothetical protein
MIDYETIGQTYLNSSRILEGNRMNANANAQYKYTIQTILCTHNLLNHHFINEYSREEKGLTGFSKHILHRVSGISLITGG